MTASNEIISASLQAAVYPRTSFNLTRNSYVEIMSNEKINLKFLAKLDKSAIESLNLFTNVYGDAAMRIYPRIFE